MTASFSKARLRLQGTGRALPGPPVSNAELLAALERHCGSRAARLAGKYLQRLGITARHLSRSLATALSGAQPGRDAPSLCREALAQAFGDRDMTYLVGHTATPHTLLPPNIAWVADGLRYAGPYVELRQACTGFANALYIAAAMIDSDKAQRIGIVGSENGSSYFDISPQFADREQLINYVQMGDGAGAVCLGADDGAGHGIVSDIFVGQIGLGREPGISISGGGSAEPACPQGLPYFRHDARGVRANGESLIAAGIAALQSRGYALRDFNWILPHQVNGHLAALFAERHPETAGKVYVTADRLGNLGSAAIWVSFDMLLRSGRLQPGDTVAVLGAEASKYLYGGFVYTH